MSKAKAVSVECPFCKKDVDVVPGQRIHTCYGGIAHFFTMKPGIPIYSQETDVSKMNLVPDGVLAATSAAEVRADV